MTQKQVMSMFDIATEAEIVEDELHNTLGLLLIVSTTLEKGTEEQRAILAITDLIDHIRIRSESVAQGLYAINHKTKASDILGARAVKKD